MEGRGKISAQCLFIGKKPMSLIQVCLSMALTCLAQTFRSPPFSPHEVCFTGLGSILFNPLGYIRSGCLPLCGKEAQRDYAACGKPQSLEHQGQDWNPGLLFQDPGLFTQHQAPPICSGSDRMAPQTTSNHTVSV